MHTTADSEPIPTVDPEKLRHELASSSARNSRLLAVFLVFLGYMLVTVGATTDLQLLLPESVIRLPILDVELSLFGFYIVAPAIVIILHYNVLLNLLLHAKKLKAWSELGNGDKKTLLPGFFYNSHLLFGPDSFDDRLLRALLTTVYCFSPLGVLLSVQIRFADYHSFPMTFLHFGFVSLDLFVAICYWYRIAYPQLLDDKYDRFKDMLQLCLEEDSFIDGLSRMGERIKATYTAPELTEARLLLVPILIPGCVLREIVIFVKPRKTIHPVYTSTFAALFVISLLYLILIIGIKLEVFQDRHRWIPHLDVSSKSLLSSAPSDVIVHAYISNGRAEADAWEEHAVGLKLVGRDLRYADLGHANLFGARLNNAKLSYARLSHTGLDLCILGDIRLNGADCFSIRLNGAFLEGAQMNGANLQFAQLNGVRANNACLRGAFLEGATLRGAQLGGCELNGARLARANLNGANLDFANLNGAILNEAQLVGTSLSGTQLKGVDLADAVLNGASLIGASLTGAFMRGACVRGVLIEDAANLSKTLYNYPGEVSCEPNWESMRSDSNRVPEQWNARDMYLSRIESASDRYESPGWTLVPFTASDRFEFVKERLKLANEDAYTIGGILAQGAIHDTKLYGSEWSLLEFTYLQRPEVVDSVLSFLEDEREWWLRDQQVRDQQSRLRSELQDFLRRKTEAETREGGGGSGGSSGLCAPVP